MSIPTQMGHDGHRRQLVGVAELSAYSRAGAAGRIALIEAGARLLGAGACRLHGAGRQVSAAAKSVSYADIVKAGVTRSFTPAEIDALPLKPVADRRLVGKPVKALDVAEKTDGTARFGIDAHVPGMVFARPVLPPTRYGAKVVSVDDSAARGGQGLSARRSFSMIRRAPCRAG